MQTVKFAKAQSSKAYASAGTVPTSETDAIILAEVEYATTPNCVDASDNTQATLYIDFTKGSLTNVLIKIYGSPVSSPAAADWYTETTEASSSGAITLYPLILTLTATTKSTWHFPIGANRGLKVTVTGTGTATSSELNLRLNLRNN